MTRTEKIAIVGAGNVGGNLGTRLAKSGFAVRFGVKPDADVKELVARCEGRAEATSVRDAVSWADVVFLALPHSAVLDVVADAGDLTGKIVVDCCNPVKFEAGEPTLVPFAEGSLAAAIASRAPGARVIKGFNTFGAEFHGDPTLGNTVADVPIAGDDAKAKATVESIATAAGFRMLDAGPLRNASLLEAMAVLWIRLAMRGGLGRQVAFKLLAR